MRVLNKHTHPSIVMHWKTVSIAYPMLSKLVMPLFGPFHPSEQTPLLQWLAPVLFKLQGTSLPPSSTICPIHKFITSIIMSVHAWIIPYIVSSIMHDMLFDIIKFIDTWSKKKWKSRELYSYYNLNATYEDFQGPSKCCALHPNKIPSQLWRI